MVVLEVLVAEWIWNVVYNVWEYDPEAKCHKSSEYRQKQQNLDSCGQR
jgi:hypothetical protein